MPKDKTTEEKQGGAGKFILKLIPYLLILILGAFGGIYAAQQKPALFGIKQSAPSAQAETDALVAKIGKIIELPSDELPTIATVTDTSNIKNQPFFSNSQIGDKVLIYQRNMKAILYRPSTNIIVEVGALSITQNATQSSSLASPKP